MRFGLIGFSQGYYATTYTRHLYKLREAEIVACCDLWRPDEYTIECAGITASEFAREMNCKLVHSLEEFFALELDAVIVASEVCEHVEHAVEALSAGCHVFVCKPLSFLPEEVNLLMMHADLAGKIVLPGNPLRYEGPLEQIAVKVLRGEIGKPTNLRIFVQHKAMLRQRWERDPVRSGGPLGTFGIYLVDTVRWMTGQEIEWLYATGDNFVFPEIQSWDTVQVMGILTGGALVQLNLVSSMSWDFPFVMIDIVGTNGVIRTDHNRYSYMMQNPDATLGNIRYDAMSQREAEHFLDCCHRRSEPKITLTDMLKVAKGIKAIEESIYSGQRVYVDGGQERKG